MTMFCHSQDPLKRRVVKRREHAAETLPPDCERDGHDWEPFLIPVSWGEVDGAMCIHCNATFTFSANDL